MDFTKGLHRETAPKVLIEINRVFSWWELSASSVLRWVLLVGGRSPSIVSWTVGSLSFCFIRVFSLLNAANSSLFSLLIALTSSPFFFFKTSISFLIYKIIAMGSGWLVSPTCTFLSFPVIFLVVTVWSL